MNLRIKKKKLKRKQDSVLWSKVSYTTQIFLKQFYRFDLIQVRLITIYYKQDYKATQTQVEIWRVKKNLDI